MSSNEIQIGWTTEAYEAHLADKAKARRRRDQEVRRSSATSRHAGKRQKLANRAAAKQSLMREVW